MPAKSKGNMLGVLNTHKEEAEKPSLWMTIYKKSEVIRQILIKDSGGREGQNGK